MCEKEFTFLISVLTPSRASPWCRTDTFASARRLPSPMLQSLTSAYSRMSLRSVRKARASAGERRSGSVTISTSGVPARLRSTAVRPGTRSCSDLSAAR